MAAGCRVRIALGNSLLVEKRLTQLSSRTLGVGLEQSFGLVVAFEKQLHDLGCTNGEIRASRSLNRLVLFV